jgi:hypothetical protein
VMNCISRFYVIRIECMQERTAPELMRELSENKMMVDQFIVDRSLSKMSSSWKNLHLSTEAVKVSDPKLHR